MAIEHRRRDDWRKRELAASSFRAECVHAGAAALPYLAPDRNQSSVAFRIGLLGGSTRPEDLERPRCIPFAGAAFHLDVDYQRVLYSLINSGQTLAAGMAAFGAKRTSTRKQIRLVR